MVLEIALVSHEADLYLVVRVVAQLIEPVVQVVKRFALSDVKHKESAHCLSIVPSRDASIALAPRCVPYLRLDDRVVRQDDSLRQEFNTNRRCHSREHSLVVPTHKPVS